MPKIDHISWISLELNFILGQVKGLFLKVFDRIWGEIYFNGGQILVLLVHFVE